MENMGILGKWGHNESKIRKNLGYLDPKDPNMTWGLLDQRVPKGNLALELEEAFKVYLDLWVDQVL